MQNDFGSDFITITDDDGNTFELEHLDTMEYEGLLYIAFLPADMDEEDEDYGIILLRVEEEAGEEILACIEDSDELDRVYEVFMKKLFEDDKL